MKSWGALLRAVNVGGTCKLPMADLRALCEDAGFDHVRTCIASGNVVLRSDRTARQVQVALQQALERNTPASRSACWCVARPRWPRCLPPIRS